MKPVTILRLLSIAAATSASFFLASCGEKKEAATSTETEAPAETAVEAEKKDTPDNLTDELIVNMNKIADAISSSKDKASAEQATESLSAISDSIADVASRLDKLETPDDAELTRLDEKMKQASAAIGQKMNSSMPTIMGNQEVAAIIGPALQEFGKRMDEHEKVFQRFIKKKEAPAPPAPAAPAPVAPAPVAPAPSAPAPAAPAPAAPAPAPAAE